MKLSEVPFEVTKDGHKYLTSLQLLQDKNLLEWFVRNESFFRYAITPLSDRYVFQPEFENDRT